LLFWIFSGACAAGRVAISPTPAPNTYTA
jgi:hypothetical protein